MELFVHINQILLLNLLRTLSITFRYSRIDLGVLDSRWWGKNLGAQGEKVPTTNVLQSGLAEVRNHFINFISIEPRDLQIAVQEF